MFANSTQFAIFNETNCCNCALYVTTEEHEKTGRQYCPIEDKILTWDGLEPFPEQVKISENKCMAFKMKVKKKKRKKEIMFEQIKMEV